MGTNKHCFFQFTYESLLIAQNSNFFSFLRNVTTMIITNLNIDKLSFIVRNIRLLSCPHVFFFFVFNLCLQPFDFFLNCQLKETLVMNNQ